MAIHCANVLQSSQELSVEFGVGVASKEFRAISDRTGLVRLGSSSAVAESFSVVQSVIREDQPYFPQIETLHDVIRLRKDPRLESFRRKLADFHSSVAAGDVKAATRFRADVRLAISRMAKTRPWERRLRWVTYLSLPAGIIENLTLGLPVLESIPFLVETLYGSRLIRPPSSSISSTSSPQSSNSRLRVSRSFGR